MSRLIDVEKLIEDIEKSRKENPHNDIKIASNHNFEHFHFIKLVNEQPTAFDVDKVVKHIEECNRIREKDMEKKIDRELRIYYEGQLFIANEIIKLIKRGGIND